MKRKLLKIFHIIAICVFIGSIPSHIILGQLADSADTIEIFTAYHQAKYLLTVALTGTGIGMTLLSGIILSVSNLSVLKANWLRVKLGLFALVVINGAFVLTPLAEAMRDMALGSVASGGLPPEFAEAAGREAMAGGINQLLLLAILCLAVVKPSFSGRRQTTTPV